MGPEGQESGHTADKSIIASDLLGDFLFFHCSFSYPIVFPDPLGDSSLFSFAVCVFAGFGGHRNGHSAGIIIASGFARDSFFCCCSLFYSVVILGSFEHFFHPSESFVGSLVAFFDASEAFFRSGSSFCVLEGLGVLVSGRSLLFVILFFYFYVLLCCLSCKNGERRKSPHRLQPTPCKSISHK